MIGALQEDVRETAPLCDTRNFTSANCVLQLCGFVLREKRALFASVDLMSTINATEEDLPPTQWGNIIHRRQQSFSLEFLNVAAGLGSKGFDSII